MRNSTLIGLVFIVIYHPNVSAGQEVVFLATVKLQYEEKMISHPPTQNFPNFK